MPDYNTVLTDEYSGYNAALIDEQTFAQQQEADAAREAANAEIEAERQKAADAAESLRIANEAAASLDQSRQQMAEMQIPDAGNADISKTRGSTMTFSGASYGQSVVPEAGPEVNQPPIPEQVGRGGADIPQRDPVAAYTRSAPQSEGAPDRSGGQYSPYDDVFRAYMGEHRDNPELLAIIAAATKAESGWVPNRVGDSGASYGLFQMHERGAGAGMSAAARSDPDTASAKMVPQFVAIYNRVKAEQPDLSGAELASLVSAMVERPADWQNPNSAARNNYRSAYNQVMGEAATGAAPFAGGAASGEVTAGASYGPYQHETGMSNEDSARLDDLMASFSNFYTQPSEAPQGEPSPGYKIPADVGQQLAEVEASRPRGTPPRDMSVGGQIGDAIGQYRHAGELLGAPASNLYKGAVEAGYVPPEFQQMNEGMRGYAGASPLGVLGANPFTMPLAAGAQLIPGVRDWNQQNAWTPMDMLTGGVDILSGGPIVGSDTVRTAGELSLEKAGQLQRAITEGRVSPEILSQIGQMRRDIGAAGRRAEGYAGIGGGGPPVRPNPWSEEHLQGLSLDERLAAVDAIKNSPTPNADLIPGSHPFDIPGLTLVENGPNALKVEVARGVSDADIARAREWAVNRGGEVASTGARGGRGSPAAAYIPWRGAQPPPEIASTLDAIRPAAGMTGTGGGGPPIEPRTYTAAQDAIDAFEDQLAQKYGENVVLKAPVYADAQTPASLLKTPISDTEMASLRQLYAARDGIQVSEDATNMAATMARIPVASEKERIVQADPNQIQMTLEKLQKDANLSQSMGHTSRLSDPETAKEVIYNELAHMLVRQGKLPADFIDRELAQSVARRWPSTEYGVSPDGLLRQVDDIVNAIFTPPPKHLALAPPPEIASTLDAIRPTAGMTPEQIGQRANELAAQGDRAGLDALMADAKASGSLEDVRLGVPNDHAQMRAGGMEPPKGPPTATGGAAGIPPEPPRGPMDPGGNGGLPRPASQIPAEDSDLGRSILDNFQPGKSRSQVLSEAMAKIRTGETWTKVQQEFLDQYVALNEIDSGLAGSVQLYAGNGAAAEMRMRQEVKPVLKVLGNDPGTLDSFQKFIQIQRDREVSVLARERGWEGRLYPTGIHETTQVGVPGSRLASPDETVRNADAALAQLRSDVGEKTWAKILYADNKRQDALGRLLDDKVRAGLVSPVTAEYLRTTQPYYNPTKFIQADQSLRGGGGAIRFNDSTLKRLTEIGSEGETESALGAFAQTIANGELAIQKNELGQKIIDTLRADSRWGPQTSKLPADFVTGPLISLDKADDGIATVATHLYGNPKDGIMRIMRDGRAEWWKLPDDDLLRNAIADLDPKTMDWILQFARGSQELTRAGATYASPAFLATNMLADLVSVYLREGAGTTAHIPEGWWHALRQDLVYQEWIRSGGGSAGFFGKTGEDMVRGLQGATGDQLLGSLGAKAFMIRSPDDAKRLLGAVWKDAMGAAIGGELTASQTDPNDPDAGKIIAAGAIAGGLARRSLGRLNEVVEQAPRIATRQAHLRAGETSAESTLASRRVTVDFHRMGSAVKRLGPVTLFLSAQMGGAAAPFRLADKGVARVNVLGKQVPVPAFRLAGLMAAAAGVYEWNKQFPDKQADIQSYINAGYLPIVNPDGWVPNADGVGYQVASFFTVPMREWAAFTAPVMAGLAAIDKQDPSIFAKGMIDTLGGYLPAAARGISAFPALARVPWDLRSNYNSFTGNPVTGRGMESVPVPLQANERTSNFSANSDLGRSLAAGPVGQLASGRTIGASPIETDYAARGIMGGAGGTALDLSNQIARRPSNNPNEIPVVSGLLKGVWRNYGGATRNRVYDEANAEYEQQVPRVMDVLKASPDYLQAQSIADPSRRFQEMHALESAANTQLHDVINARHNIPSAANSREIQQYPNVRQIPPRPGVSPEALQQWNSYTVPQLLQILRDFERVDRDEEFQTTHSDLYLKLDGLASIAEKRLGEPSDAALDQRDLDREQRTRIRNLVTGAVGGY